MKIAAAAAALLTLTVGTAMATEDQCVGLRKLTESRTAATGSPLSAKLIDMLTGIAALLSRHETTGEQCASLFTVISQLVNGRKHGGNRLEEDEPLDVRQAQAQLGEAEQDADIRSLLGRAKSSSDDRNIQLILEAAVLDSEGLNSARDLQIQTVREQLHHEP